MARKNYSEIISQRINARRAKQEEAAQASSGKLLERLSERLSGSSHESANASESTEDFITRTYNDALSRQQGYRDTIFTASEKKEAGKRNARQEKRAQAIANATGTAPANNAPANSMTAEEYKTAADIVKQTAFARNMPQTRPADMLKNQNAQYEAAKVIPNKVPPISEEKDRFAAAIGSADLLANQRKTAQETDAEAEKQKRIHSARPVNDVLKDIDAMDEYISKAKKDKLTSELGILVGNRGLHEQASERLEYLENEKKKLEQELNESRYAERELLRESEDFEKNSQYKSTENGEEHRVVTGQSGIVTSVTGFKDPLYEYVNKNPDVIKALRESKAGESAAASFFGIDNSYIEQMDADEVAMFNYITNKEGSEKAREYLESITSDLTKRQNAQDTANYAKFAEEHPVLASAYSAATSPLKASAAVGQTVDYLTDGKIDQNAGYNRTVNTNNAIREKVNQTVTEKWGEKGSFAYQTGMGMADFIVTTAATGGFLGLKSLPLAIMGVSAVADTVISAKERGLSDDQAYSLGIVAGAVEAAAEKAGLDALFGKINFGKNKIASAFAYMLKNALAEGTEEGATELANFFADIVVSKDKSEWNQSISEYKKQGMSEKEAFNKAFADQAVNVGMAFAGGLTSGAILGTASALIQTTEIESEKRNSNKDAEDQKNSTVKALESATDTNVGGKTDTPSAAPSVEAAQQTAPAETPYEIDEEIPASEFDSYILRAVQTGRITQAEADALDAEYSRTFSKKEAEDGIKRITAERQKGQISEEDFDTQYEAYQNQIDKTELKTASSTFRVRLRPIQNQPVTVQTTPRQDAGAPRRNEGSVQERAGEAFEEIAETPTEEENAPDASESKPKTTQLRASYTTDARTMRDTGTATTAAEEFLSEDSTAEDAADELVRYYGSVHEAVKHLQGIREKTRSGGASENAEMFNRVRDVERQIVNENKSRVTKHTKDIARYLSDYGVRDVVIDDPDAKKLYGTPKEDGYFDPKDNTIHITAHSSENKVLDSIISHEFSHRAMREDPQLVSDILSARDHLAEIGKYRELYTPENYRAAYADQIKGKSAEETENFIREEMAAHFMGDIFGSENLAQSLAKDNRSLIRRILDFIVDKFDPKGKDHRAGMRAADKIRRMLDDLDGKTTTKRKPKTSETAGTSDDIRYSRDLNDTYMEAVNSGDMEAAQRMVDEAAKNAGYTRKLYHGTNAFGFTVIDTKKSNDKTSFFATNSAETAGTYSGTNIPRNIGEKQNSSLGMYQFYANTNNMLELDAKGAESNHIELGSAERDYNYYMMTKTWRSYATAKQVSEYAKKKGYAGVIIKNVIDTATPDSRGNAKSADVYNFFNPQAQVKSADPVTYDDNGNVIPLSERFKPGNDDIRYSRDVETADEKRLRNAKDWNDYYRRQYTAHTAFGKAKAVKPSERHRIAVEISHDIPGVSSAQVERLLKEYFDILERPKNGAQDTAQARWEEAETALGRISAEIVDNAVQTQINPLYEPLRDLRRKLRETPIKSDVSAAEFGGEADYKAWRKGNTGLLRISTVSNALPIDTFYQELSGEYPDFFPEDITNTADQLKRLGEIAVSIKETASNKFESVNPLEEVRMQAVEDVKARMRSSFDKYARLTDAAKSEVENAANKNDVLQARAEGQSAERYNSIMLEDILKTSQQDGKRLQREIDRQNKRIQKLEDSISDTDMNLKRDFERQKHRAELERLYKMLTEPTKRAHVPDSLKNITARTLAAFDGEKTSGNKTVDAEFMKKIADTVIHTGVTKDYVAQNFSDAVENGMKRATEYRAALEAITPEDFKANPEESARKAAQLEYDYLRESNAVLEMIGNYITNANRVFIAGRAEEATDFAREIRSDMSDKNLFSEETARNGFGSTMKNEGRSFFRRMHYEAASPTQFFALFGESGKKILKTLQSARDVQKAREEAFADYMLEATGGKYNTSEASGIGGKRITINIGGKDTDISRAQLMYVYALWKDPSARYEMKNGGISILDANGSEVSDRRYTITNKTFAEITEKLSDEDKKIADAIEKFLSGPCAEWGNEATLRMFGYSRFTKKDYMPVRTVFEAKETAKSEKPASLEDAVFTRARNTEAKSPVIIGDIFDIATHHVKHMAAYSANAPVINDLNLVFAQEDVKHDIRRGLGKEGEEYLEWFMQKLNDPNELTNSESATYGFMQWLGSTAQRAAVNSNVSSAVKQFLSLPRAFVEISPKYILKAYADTGFTGRRKGKGTYGTTYRRMTEHSGIAKIKMLGFSDTGYGKSIRQIYDPSYIRQSGTGLRRILTASKPTAATLRAYDRMNEFGMLAAEKADENVWTHLYRACELEVIDTHPNASTEEREALATSRFNQLVGDTQVVDSLLDTARGKENFKNKAVGYFMSEPLKTYAMLCGAIDGVKDAQALVKKNPTDANRKKLKAARTKLNKTTAAIIATNIALEPLISAFFRTTRDEEDDSEQFFAKMFRYFSGVDLTEEKLSAEPLDVLSSEVVAGLFDIIPVVGAVYDIVETAMQGFSSDRFELTNFVKLLKSAEDVISDAGNSEDGKKSTDTTFKNIMDLISAAASVAGTGFSNVYRDVNAAIRAALHLSDNHHARWEYNKLLYNIENSSALSQKNFYDILAHTIKEGDMEAYEQMREDLANLPRASSLGVSVSAFADNIEKRGVEPITPDSPLWNIEIQARFALGDLNTANSYAEKLIAEVYNDLPDSKKTNVLYTSPNKTALEEQIKRELTYAEYENAVREIGTDAYKTLIELNSINRGSSTWKNLSTNQKRYTLETIYDYARYTGRKKLNPEYETKTNWMQELYKSSPTRAQIVKTILARAAEQPKEAKE